MTSTERAPLLNNRPDRLGVVSPFHRVLLIVAVLSITFALTQPALLYSFREMTCNEYYAGESHSAPPGVDRCALPSIEASTARSLAKMSATNSASCEFS